MRRLLGKLKGIFGAQAPPSLSEDRVEELRTAFQDRYHNFKLLLAANQRALETMARLETTLSGGRPYGMSTVRAGCTSIAAGVFQMVKHLTALAPGRYEELFNRLKIIQAQAEEALRPSPPVAGEELVLELSQLKAGDTFRVGGKMANLGEVANRVGLPTPPGFAVTAQAQRQLFGHNHLQEEIDRLVLSTVLESTDRLFALSSRLQQLITGARPPDEVNQALERAYASLARRTQPEVTVSMRSSALGEDGGRTSFAGLYRSQLNVHPSHLMDSYLEVLASQYTPQAMHYRYLHGLRDEELPMCVGCLAMVDAAAGGVAYSTSPIDARDRRVHISAALGLAKGVVDGDAPADLLVVERGSPMKLVESRIAHKHTRFDCFAQEGVCRLSTVEDLADQPALPDDKALELAGYCLRLEEHYGGPVDVEWAWDRQGGLVILQCRPLTTVGPEPEEQDQAPPPVPVPEVADVLLAGAVGVSPGAGAGPVFWVRKDSDALRFPPGAVLVVEQALPRWAALLGGAVAVVSQQGGLAGHLATVAREYGVPAVFGTGERALVLEDGITVTVDGDGGNVLVGRVEAFLTRATRRPGLMAGSPVERALKEALACITPLNLLNPEGVDFAPQSCRTLHDITRFCHEQAVREMFNFGKEHHFPQRSSKQLHYQVPMQYWILNLDDGFKEEVEGKYVTLDNIACPPMLALWEGMVAVPWDGPPAVSGRGLASVMFQATANPALASPFKSQYANRNYFMISRHFMSLQSRFGFHFATVEALVSERDRENYVSFSFAGGAADQARRQSRARFIARLLEPLGFGLEIKGDTLRARVEGLGQGEMLGAVKKIGYLIMHTRQLDMIMGEPAAVARYQAKMEQELAGLDAVEPAPAS